MLLPWISAPVSLPDPRSNPIFARPRTRLKACARTECIRPGALRSRDARVFKSLPDCWRLLKSKLEFRVRTDRVRCCGGSSAAELAVLAVAAAALQSVRAEVPRPSPEGGAPAASAVSAATIGVANSCTIGELVYDRRGRLDQGDRQTIKQLKEEL